MPPGQKVARSSRATTLARAVRTSKSPRRPRSTTVGTRSAQRERERHHTKAPTLAHSTKPRRRTRNTSAVRNREDATAAQRSRRTSRCPFRADACSRWGAARREAASSFVQSVDPLLLNTPHLCTERRMPHAPTASRVDARAEAEALGVSISCTSRACAVISTRSVMDKATGIS